MISEYIAAARSPPRSDPANSQAFRPRAIPRSARSAALLLKQIRHHVSGFTRRRPVRGPLPEHLPRERVVVPSPTACPCCGGRLAKLGESITETLEVVPRQWKVIQTVREKWSCRSCETISQPPAPFHPIVRGRLGVAGRGLNCSPWC